MRGKGKQTIVWLLMGMLVLGLGGFGVSNFSGGTADVGQVGGVEISSQDYARALRAQKQEFAAQTGKQVSPAEAKAFGLDQAALSRLFVEQADSTIDLADTGLLGSIDIVELNPALDLRNQTAELVVDLVQSLFGKSTLVKDLRR